MLSNRHAGAVMAIEKEFIKAEFRLFKFMLNAKDYGVAQDRKGVFCGF